MDAVRSFDQLKEKARSLGPKRVAVILADDADLLLALAAGVDEGMTFPPVLVGSTRGTRKRIEELALDESMFTFLETSTAGQAAAKAVALARDGQVDLLMKGKVSTGDFLRAVLDKEMGLVKGGLLVSVAIFECPSLDRLLILCDGGVNIAPDLKQKVQITMEAVRTARMLGIDPPHVAVLAATELVNPSMSAATDAACLSKMAERGQIPGAIIDGPLALDNALSLEAARQKGISSPVAGKADIVIVPNIESGNLLGKAIVYCGSGKMAGVVMGAACPLILPSRADTHESKLASLALGVCVAQ